MQEIPDGAKKIAEIYRQLENQKCKEDLLFFGEAILRAQEAFRADYGLPDREPDMQAGRREAV
jgi:hypothetical protein